MSDRAGQRGASGQPGEDRRLLRRVRRRLVLWSAGVTLVILLVLGSAVFIGVASSLRATNEDQLRERATALARALSLQPLLQETPAFPFRNGLGIAFGGRASGTLAVVITPDGSVVGAPADFGSVPDPGGETAVRASGSEAIDEVRFRDNPVRVLSMPVALADGTYVVQVVADRGAEERTLAGLAIVLLIGGLAGLALASVGGWFYASRALFPIRESLRRQREFAADASHELRTPLAVARAAVDLLARHPQARVSDLRETTDDLRAGLDHMTDLVDTLLLLARADSGTVTVERAEVDLADLAATALAGLEPLARERGIVLSLDAEPAEVQGDPLRLRQLVTILADNAVRHGRRDGHVWVRVRPRPSGGSAAARPGAELTVDDDGPGIPAADRTRIFERFWRGPEAAQGGAGLGLSIAAWIAGQHGGSIAADERPGGGARFTVALGG